MRGASSQNSLPKKIIIATRGSALALAQAGLVQAEFRRRWPALSFELQIIRTTGDKLQKASMARIDSTLPRGLFTKELEVALADGSADLAVHSLKDLPTELPEGLILGAVLAREDVRDVLIYPASMGARRLKDFPRGATVATSSTRRRAQLLAARPDLKVVEIRGNVATRLEKLAASDSIDGTLLAAAGLARLNFEITAAGRLRGAGVPAGLRAVRLTHAVMLPCVGQGAIGIEIRVGDAEIAALCQKVNDRKTFQCVTAERSFLRAMGVGCQSPIGAHARIRAGKLVMDAVVMDGKSARRGTVTGPPATAEKLGKKLASRLT